MSKKTKNVKRYLRFQKKIKFILHDNKMHFLLKHHYDHCGRVLTYILYFIVYWTNDRKIIKKILQFKDEWILLFTKFYQNKKIQKIFTLINNNPQEFDINNIKMFDEIKSFIKMLIFFIKKQQIQLLVSDDKTYNIIFLSLRYLFYNSAISKISQPINKILIDLDYDKKYIITLNNITLFANAKNCILHSCGNKVSDLISFLFGCSNELFK